MPLLFCIAMSNAVLWETLYLQKALVAVALPLLPHLTALFSFPPQHVVCTGRLRWYPDPSVIHCIQSCEVSRPCPQHEPYAPCRRAPGNADPLQHKAGWL